MLIYRSLVIKHFGPGVAARSSWAFQFEKKFLKNFSWQK